MNIVAAGNGLSIQGEAEITMCTSTRLTVPDSKSRNIPEVVFVWRWTVGV
jgi:hypothetical protein